MIISKGIWIINHTCSLNSVLVSFASFVCIDFLRKTSFEVGYDIFPISVKEFIDLRKIICLRKCVSLVFKISTGMHFIPLQSMVCVSYHCRNGVTSYCVVIATEGVRL